ncbi:MAG: ribosome assembly cofactor RimP [Bacteroidota bacterium]|nr:ribosome assembly cofactor RimP [Bacteroidota bacterium]
MITDKLISEIVNNAISQSELFIVDITVKAGNKILVLADSPNGISIDECAMISRAIEQHLNRDVEDFELEVSSPGLSQPFKVIQQFQKNIGRQVEVILKDSDKHYGKLISAENGSFTVETKERVKLEGKKKAEQVIQQHIINLDEVKSTKVVINF